MQGQQRAEAPLCGTALVESEITTTDTGAGRLDRLPGVGGPEVGHGSATRRRHTCSSAWARATHQVTRKAATSTRYAERVHYTLGVHSWHPGARNTLNGPPRAVCHDGSAEPGRYLSA